MSYAGCAFSGGISAATQPSTSASASSTGAAGSRRSSKAASATSSGVSEAGRRWVAIMSGWWTGRRGYSSPLLLRVGKEQLLAIDLVTGDRGLPLRRNQPIHEGLAKFLLHGGIFFRINQHDAVLIEQPLVSLDDNLEIAAIPERYPGAAVGENIGIHCAGGVGASPHALADFRGPSAFVGARYVS